MDFKRWVSRVEERHLFDSLLSMHIYIYTVEHAKSLQIDQTWECFFCHEIQEYSMLWQNLPCLYCKLTGFFTSLSRTGAPFLIDSTVKQSWFGFTRSWELMNAFYVESQVSSCKLSFARAWLYLLLSASSSSSLSLSLLLYLFFHLFVIFGLISFWRFLPFYHFKSKLWLLTSDFLFSIGFSSRFIAPIPSYWGSPTQIEVACSTTKILLHGC